MGETIDERHNVENMKSGYVGGCIVGKDVAETMTEKLKSKEEEVKKIVKDKEKKKVKLTIIQVIPNGIVAKKKVHASMEIRWMNCLTGNCM